MSYPFLESHPQHQLALEQMRHGGTILAVELDGDFETCKKFVSQLRLAHVATSFGGPETLVCHPATSTQAGLSTEELSKMGVTQGLLRFSIGLENSDDLIQDITSALQSI